MKFSTMMAVLAVAVSFAACGCRYNKAGANGDFGAAGDDSAKGGSISTSEIGEDDLANQSGSGSLDELTGAAAGASFADLYARCNDVSFQPVYFGFDSAVLPQGELAKIDAVASHLAENDDRVIIVEGHCDERGSNEYNLPLGENRAITVRNCLVQYGVAADRIQTRSFGAEMPAVEGHDESAWAKNRRGEFAVYSTKASK